MNKEYDPRKIERERDLLIAGNNLKEKIFNSSGIFTETITLIANQKTNLLPCETNKIVRSFFYHLVQERFYGEEITENLFKTALIVNKKFPELIFNFQKDDEGYWMKYTVTQAQDSK